MDLKFREYADGFTKDEEKAFEEKYGAVLDDIAGWMKIIDALEDKLSVKKSGIIREMTEHEIIEIATDKLTVKNLALSGYMDFKLKEQDGENRFW